MTTSKEPGVPKGEDYRMSEYLKINKSVIPLFIPLLMMAFWLGSISNQMSGVSDTLDALVETQKSYLLTQKDVENLSGDIVDLTKAFNHHTKAEVYYNLETRTVDGLYKGEEDG